MNGHWNYRVMSFEQHEPGGRWPRKETWLAIHEVYYDHEGVPRSYAAEAAPVIAYEGETLERHLEMLAEALTKPVLTPADFGRANPTGTPRELDDTRRGATYR